jgi:hypothetical protein
MISILICSINPAYLQQVKKSVEETIGLPYEILVFDNRQAGLGLCAVYNQLAEKARFPYLVFMHEDISFESQNWGAELINLFASDRQIGLIGVAGSNYKSRLFTGWDSGIAACDAYHITHLTNGEKIKLTSWPPGAIDNVPVVCIDGVFMACRKEIWAEFPFNEGELKGFHFYDLDFSLRVAGKFQLRVTLNIPILHHTVGGDYGDKWVKEVFHFHRYFPLPFPNTLLPKRMESEIGKYWLDRLKNHPISFANRCRWIRYQKLWTNPAYWYSIVKFMVYRPLKLRKIHELFK